MKWREGSESPKVSGKYQILVESRYLPVPFSGEVSRATFSVWYSTNQNRWEESAKILAWLDPEIPEKYLPESLQEPVKTNSLKMCPICHQQPCRNLCVDFAPGPKTELKFEAEGNESEKPKGEWLPVGRFEFDRSKYYWVRAKDEVSIVDGEVGEFTGRYRNIEVWSEPIKEPPR